MLVLLNWLRSLPSLFDRSFTAQLITQSEGEPFNSDIYIY